MFIPTRPFLTLAATLCVAALAIAAAPANAQFSGNTTYDATNHAYFVTGDATLSGDVSDNEIFLGKDNATNFAMQPGSNTLTIATGATTTYYGNTYPGGGYYQGVNVFGSHKVAISGGSVLRAYGNNTSTTNISGGTLTDGFLLYDTTATANFVGTGLSFVYTGYGNSNAYNEYADSFTVSGTIGGVPNTSYNLYIRNATGAGGTPNSAPRQFAFNGVVVVPEAGTLALLLPALGLLATALVRRKTAGV